MFYMFFNDPKIHQDIINIDLSQTNLTSRVI